MVGFNTLPQDIFSIILQFLSLADVLNLRQVCQLVNLFISNDKQFWVHRLEDGLFEYGCHLPVPRPSLDSLSAPVLESWTRRLLGLRRTYTSTGAASVSLTDSLPPVTWVKLVRGRWCLAAVSDSTSSRLLLYDGLVGFESGPQAEVNLPGPVMDGVLEDTSLEINIALSIGTINPFIQIASLCTYHEGSAQFILRAVVPMASCTRFIQGHFAGFAMLDGDDQYPRVADWTTGKILSLIEKLPGSDSSIETPDGIYEQGICRGMAFWSDRIVSVFGNLIKIFSMPDGKCENAPILVAALSLNLINPVSEVYFVTLDSRKHPLEARRIRSPTSLYLIIRDTHCIFGVIEILHDLTINTDLSELWWQKSYETRLYSPEDADVPYISCLGSTGSAFCYCTINTLYHLRLPKFYVALVKSSFFADNENKHGPTIVPTDGFLMLHEYPCLDFDDARGVVLVGNCRGELGLIEFEGGGVHEGIEIGNDLPCSGAEAQHNLLLPSVSNMDLGLYYEWHFRTPVPRPFADEPKIDVPDYIINDYIKNRCTTDANWTPPEGWSNDWRQFKYLDRWLAPYLFWGESDTIISRRPIAHHLRNAYHIYGRPILLLFHKHEDYVFFRIGSRSFLAMFDFPLNGMVVFIGRVYLSHEQILSGEVPNEIIENYLARELVAFGNMATRYLGSHKSAVSNLIKFSREAGLVNLNDNHRHWSQDKWDYLDSVRKEYIKCTRDRRGDYGEILAKWLEDNKNTKFSGM